MGLMQKVHTMLIRGSIAADKGACSRGFAKRGSCARNEYASHKP